MTEKEMRNWIDSASYTELLSKWRYAPAGDPFFRGEVGKYYDKVMTKKRWGLKPGEHTAISKAIG